MDRFDPTKLGRNGRTSPDYRGRLPNTDVSENPSFSDPAGKPLDWNRVQFLDQNGLRLKVLYDGRQQWIEFRRPIDLEDFLRTWSETLTEPTDTN